MNAIEQKAKQLRRAAVARVFEAGGITRDEALLAITRPPERFRAASLELARRAMEKAS